MDTIETPELSFETPDTFSPETDDDTSNAGKIVGLLIGGAIAVGAAVVIRKLWKQRNSKEEIKDPSELENPEI